jgi:hypothetical protein
MSCPNSPLKTSRCIVLSHSNEKLDSALALAGLAIQVYALFAVAVALGGPGHSQALRTHFYRPIFTDRFAFTVHL